MRIIKGWSDQEADYVYILQDSETVFGEFSHYDRLKDVATGDYEKARRWAAHYGIPIRDDITPKIYPKSP